MLFFILFMVKARMNVTIISPWCSWIIVQILFNMLQRVTKQNIVIPLVILTGN